MVEITRAQNRNYALAEGFHRMARQPTNTWSLFLRYQAQAERHYRRAVEEFDRLKALRAELPNEPIWEAQPEENEPACTPPDEPISTPVGQTIVVCGLSGSRLQARRCQTTKTNRLPRRSRCHQLPESTTYPSGSFWRQLRIHPRDETPLLRVSLTAVRPEHGRMKRHVAHPF